MFKVPEEYRVATGVMGSTSEYGDNGLFYLKFQGYLVKVIASSGLGWNHCSVTINRNRTPSWEIMCYVKSKFWGEEDTVIQYHPPASQYVNMHPYCLHLWEPHDIKIPVPDPILIGIR